MNYEHKIDKDSDLLFEDLYSGSRRTVKVVSAIIGKCWKAPCRNTDIAKFLGVTNGAISAGIKGLLPPKSIIEKELSITGDAILLSINFQKLIYYLIDFAESDFTKEEKEKILSLVIRNRKVVGDAFLEVFGHEGEGVFKNGLNKLKKIFELVPEWLFVVILTLDEEGRKNNHYNQFLLDLSKQIIITLKKKYPVIGNSMFGLTSPLVQQMEISLSKKQKVRHRISLSLSEDEIESLSEDEIQSKIKAFVTIFLKSKEFRKLFSIIMDNYSVQSNFVILKPNEQTKKIEWILIGDKARDFLDIFLEKMCP